ncbi:TPA: AraC family transcriptional regulator, partial [Klebsiella pneumoniae subsp. pneumoniae]|nr:AraC family transcriptional regulator [Klebsiella pneumoniae subsp. pneumoniae]HBY2080910.1 AraC family transcriptional regulator [Klebsiella pneumoniae]HBX3624004.1 AraC family transcriptional regulator [Klebsiella pneumoniae subsp. pneumoniae]HBX3624009.1 AraC family transcriptional regulator [Klebsiella pneumoniae subsp. pneumoniae]HBX3624014.1 AraC family transcriptional regulator [Klebsiella pneumoniae subsp. pneumoniae]
MCKNRPPLNATDKDAFNRPRGGNMM